MPPEDEDNELYPEDWDTPIPRELYSEYEERPFRSCTRCGESLLEFAEGYQVAKIFKRGETVFEYALCGPCHRGLIDEFSDESKRRLEDYYNEHMQPGLGGEVCGICAQHRDQLHDPEFALGAMCNGSSLLETFMLCNACMEKTNELVSEKTRGIWGDFINDNFPGVPANFAPDPLGVPIF